MSFLGDIFGGLFGDGGSSSSSVTSTVNIDVQGLNNIGVNETIDLKPITIKPLQVTLDENIDVKPLTLNENIDVKPLTLNENIDVKPLTLNENVDLRPVTLNENIDLKPVALDTCQTFRLAPLPDTRVSNPYHHRVSYGFFGIEIMSVSYTGESGQNIDSPHRPQVVEGPDWVGGHREAGREVIGESGGIRVRLLHPDGQ